MPLHKSNRASRLDPTMISAPLGDFRHTMHIGRGGDAFGDTSFLSTLGPGQAAPPAATPVVDDHQAAVNHGELQTDAPGSPENHELQHSESVSSFTLDLDLGPSMLGDVLGVMDGLGLEEEEGFGPSSGGSPRGGGAKLGNGSTETPLNPQSDWNGKSAEVEEESRTPDGNGLNKPKGLKPKVRFSDKREEIIRQASEEEEGQSLDFQGEDDPSGYSPTRSEGRGEGHRAQPQSPASSHSSEQDGVTSLDRRRADSCHSETESEDEDEAGRGYTFEDEFDDEIGL